MNSQKARILAWLTQRHLCATTIREQQIPCGPTVISKLRSEGWDIETRECTQHEHRTRQVEYVLHNSPGVLYPSLAKDATPPIYTAT